MDITLHSDQTFLFSAASFKFSQALFAFTAFVASFYIGKIIGAALQRVEAKYSKNRALNNLTVILAS